MSLIYLVSIIGQWAGSIYVPTAITQIALRGGAVAADAARMASYGGMVLAIGTVIGCLLAPDPGRALRPPRARWPCSCRCCA